MTQKTQTQKTQTQKTQKTEKKIRKLEDLFVETLQDLYDAEHQITKALPVMAEHARSKELKQGFKDHLQMTERQIQRLEQVFQEMDMKPKGKHCKGMEGLIKEGQEIMKEDIDPAVLDAALIGAAQKVEHYEIAGYGTARAYAQMLGHQNIAKLLDQSAKEEGNTDKLLTSIAESHVNRRAE